MVDFLRVRELYLRPRKSYHRLVATVYKTHNLQTSIGESLDLSYNQNTHGSHQNPYFGDHSCTIVQETSPRVS